MERLHSRWSSTTRIGESHHSFIVDYMIAETLSTTAGDCRCVYSSGGFEAKYAHEYQEGGTGVLRGELPQLRQSHWKILSLRNAITYIFASFRDATRGRSTFRLLFSDRLVSRFPFDRLGYDRRAQQSAAKEDAAVSVSRTASLGSRSILAAEPLRPVSPLRTALRPQGARRIAEGARRIAEKLVEYFECETEALRRCRWAGQGALVNKTMYYYGGQATLTPNVIANSWTNALLSVDLARDWPIGQPALRLLQPDSGNPRSPPAVSRTSFAARFRRQRS